ARPSSYKPTQPHPAAGRALLPVGSRDFATCGRPDTVSVARHEIAPLSHGKPIILSYLLLVASLPSCTAPDRERGGDHETDQGQPEIEDREIDAGNGAVAGSAGAGSEHPDGLAEACAPKAAGAGQHSRPQAGARGERHRAEDFPRCRGRGCEPESYWPVSDSQPNRQPHLLTPRSGRST